RRRAFRAPRGCRQARKAAPAITPSALRPTSTPPFCGSWTMFSTPSCCAKRPTAAGILPAQRSRCLDSSAVEARHRGPAAPCLAGTHKMALSNVKALTFDVFGTVVNWRDSIAREAKSFLGPRGYDKDWHAFADRWRARYQPAMEKVRKGERPWARLDDLHRENLIELLKEFDIAGVGEADIDGLNRAWHRLDGWPDSVEGLTRLKR